MNGKETRIAKIVFQKENKLEGICLLDSRAYIGTVIKCVTSAEGQTHISKELSWEPRNMPTQINLILIKVQKQFKEEK